MMRNTWLIRCAESISNSGGSTESPQNAGLSERGKIQANVLSREFAATPDLIVLSPFRRALDTAGPIIAKFPDSPLDTWPVQDFVYLSPGRFKSTSPSQRSADAKAYWEKADPQHCDGPGAETFEDYFLRVDGFLERIRRRQESLSYVITHAYFIKAIMWRMLNAEAETTPDFMRGFRAFYTSYHLPNIQLIPLAFDESNRVYLASSRIRESLKATE